VILFSVAGAGSMVSGYLYAELGWTTLLMFTVIMVRYLTHFENTIIRFNAYVLIMLDGFQHRHGDCSVEYGRCA
jgi:hypothetical protein